MSNSNPATESPKRGWRCPSSAQLAAYIDGSVSAGERRALERHLADCSYCLDLVGGVVSGTQQTAPATPVWLQQKAEELGGQTRAKNWRWAWALAPVLTGLLVVAVFVKSPTQSEKMAPPVGPSNSPAITAHQQSEQTSNHPAEPTRSAHGQTELLRLITPSQGAALSPNRLQFEWTPASHATYYQVRIMTAEGKLVWEGRSEQAHVRLPGILKITPGNYFVWVSAYLNDGRELQSAPTRFRVQAER